MGTQNEDWTFAKLKVQRFAFCKWILQWIKHSLKELVGIVSKLNVLRGRTLGNGLDLDRGAIRSSISRHGKFEMPNKLQSRGSWVSVERFKGDRPLWGFLDMDEDLKLGTWELDYVRNKHRKRTNLETWTLRHSNICRLRGYCSNKGDRNSSKMK